jgi:hypothetical protein
MRQQSDITQIRIAALAVGALFLLLGLAGYAGITTGPESAYPGPGYGYVLGLFPTNYLHNALGILTGLWGIAAFTSIGGAIAFHQVFTIVYAAQAILGLLPFTHTLFGTMPLYGNNVWLSLLLTAVTYYYGFVKAGAITSRTGLTANAK